MIELGTILIAIALGATLVARRAVAGAARHNVVAARLRTLYSLVSALLALRLVLSGWPAPIIVSLMMIAAAWLPLAALRLGEELVRRHAARRVKTLALAGAVVFSVLAATLGMVWNAQAIISLALFQLAVMGTVLFHLFNNRGTISPAERGAADTILLALLLAIPLLLTDFQQVFPDLTVRGGAFAALLLVLATSRLISGYGRPAALFVDVAVMLGAGGIVALAAAGIAIPEGDVYPLATCTAALAALVLLVERFARTQREEGGLIEAVAYCGNERSAILSAHPLLAGGEVIEGAALADMPEQALEGLAAMRVIGPRMDDAQWADAANELLGRHSASHLLRLSAVPPRFLAVMGGSLGEERLDAELEIVARLLEREP